MTKHVKDLVSSILPKPEAWKLLLLQDWNSIVGDLKFQVRLDQIRTDTLILSVANTSWMQELYCLSDVLIKKINARLDYPHVKKLRFKCSSSTKSTDLKKISTKKTVVTHEIVLTVAQKKALEKINDLQLQHALKNFLIRCYREQL
jgi:hypothetical protein